MSFYVEVMCNLRKQWPSTPEYSGMIHHRCTSDCGDNPQGRSLAEAASEARAQGWSVMGRYAICPQCRQVLPGEKQK